MADITVQDLSKAIGTDAETLIGQLNDAGIKVSKAELIATLEIEKQKDAAQSGKIHMMLGEYDWNEGCERTTTLVPERSQQGLAKARKAQRNRDAEQEVLRFIDHRNRQER